MTDAALHRLADAAGLIVDWDDATGQPQRVTPDSLRTILRGLGFPADSQADRADSAARLATPDADDATMIVMDQGRPAALPRAHGPARLTLADGTVRSITLNGTVPAIDRPGYHQLAWADDAVTLAVAPPRCHPLPAARRHWGAATQLYALRGATPSPFGDFGTLADFVGVAAAHGADAVAISPVHALFGADPARFSPYAPSSRRYLNPLFADPGLLGIPPLPDPGAPLIDWPAAAAARQAQLRCAYAALGGAAAGSFAAYAQAADADLRAHALFETLHAHFFAQSNAAGWQDWPGGCHDPTGPAVRAFAAAHADAVRYQLFLQWLSERSLRAARTAADTAGMAIGLIADIAVGLDPGGSHGWSRRDDLMMDLRIGAPPDAYQAAGQNWGITSFSPAALRRTGYAPFIAMLRTAMASAGGVRIDHALGLRRLWVAPEGASPLDGAYLRYPEADLLRLVALESHLARSIVIGEDLGVVPPGFRGAIADRAILGMRVLPFERDSAGTFTPPAGWERQAVAMTSTHDMTPIAGWWTGTDIGWRARIDPAAPVAAERRQRADDRQALWDACTASGHATGPQPADDDPGPALDAALAHTAASACDLLIVPVEDLFGLDQAPNLPGTVDTHPNWQRRLPDTAARLFSAPAVRDRVARITESRTG